MFKFWKRKPAAMVPESVAEATSLADYPDDHPGWSRLSAALVESVESHLQARAVEQEERTAEALLAYQRDGDADAAMRVFRGVAS